MAGIVPPKHRTMIYAFDLASLLMRHVSDMWVIFLKSAKKNVKSVTRTRVIEI
ncbi:hypothetical protein YC2023_081518 [Brassica napus]